MFEPGLQAKKQQSIHKVPNKGIMQYITSRMSIVTPLSMMLRSKKIWNVAMYSSRNIAPKKVFY